MAKRKIQPYDIVSRQRYEQELDERLYSEELHMETEAKLRHRRRGRHEAMYASDFLVMVVGRTAAGKLTEVKTVPMDLDTGALMPAYTRVMVDAEGMIVRHRRWPLRLSFKKTGYFLEGPEIGEVSDLSSEADIPESTELPSTTDLNIIAPAS